MLTLFCDCKETRLCFAAGTLAAGVLVSREEGLPSAGRGRAAVGGGKSWLEEWVTEKWDGKARNGMIRRSGLCNAGVERQQ